MTDKNLNNVTQGNEPPDRGSIQREPNVAPEPPPAPPLVEAASQSGRHPTHEPPGRSERSRR